MFAFADVSSLHELLKQVLTQYLKIFLERREILPWIYTHKSTFHDGHNWPSESFWAIFPPDVALATRVYWTKLFVLCLLIAIGFWHENWITTKKLKRNSIITNGFFWQIFVLMTSEWMYHFAGLFLTTVLVTRYFLSLFVFCICPLLPILVQISALRFCKLVVLNQHV